MPGEREERLSDHFICVTQGDSGGPLVMEDGQSGLFTLIGVVTGEILEYSNIFVTQLLPGGVGCGDARYPGLYVNVRHHLDWIKEVIEKN